MVIRLFFVSQNTFACLSIALLDACVLLKHPQPSPPDLIGIVGRTKVINSMLTTTEFTLSQMKSWYPCYNGCGNHL